MSNSTFHDQQPLIRIGLITDGNARVRPAAGDRWIVENLLIGKGFHWQRPLEILVEGDVEIRNGKAINTIPLERYVASVIASEMNPASPEEFLKAHAVISRSWAARKLRHSVSDDDPMKGNVCNDSTCITWQESCDHVGFDVCSDDHCQRYQGIPRAGSERAQKAVADTAGMVLTGPDGEIADTRFSKCCGGKTELFSTCWADRDIPYLVSKSDPWCDLSDMDPEERSAFLASILKDYDGETSDFYSWESEIPVEKIGDRIREICGIDIGTPLNIESLRRGHSGRIYELKAEGSRGNLLIGKELTIRRVLSENCLYSSAFEITRRGDRFHISGKGWGHGVGLCQIGAAGMASAGKDFREILSFYYPDTSLTKLY